VINAFDAGVRTRYYREQIRLLEAQRKAYEADLRRAEAESAARRPAASPTQADVERVKQEVSISLAIFTARHPDWKQYETRMVHFSYKVTPGPISMEEYMEILYTLAKAYPLQPVEDKPAGIKQP